ncbi:TonB-dependent receptor (plasmid) [Brevundimonas staleyi]|uniref:TonB-dependent receptor n=1 Tax=Brevundimonas staleyi TaxID=74326 RepID=A0ABW0FT25_9CAUL
MHRYRLIQTSSLAALAAGASLGLAAPAAAQSGPSTPSQESTALDDVVVTGFRAQAAAAIEAKRDVPQISDSVAADEIARLPDFNLAEALSRVPGVSTVQDNGEDRFVAIRGMNGEYNYSTIDGFALPSTDEATRKLLLDIVPSTVVRRVDVVKSFTADLDGQAIGGRIDLVTRSAFDRNGDGFFAGNASIGYWENDHQGPDRVKPSANLSAAYSTRFGPQDQFGFVTSGTYWRSDRYTVSPTVSGNRYDFYDASGKLLDSPLDPASNGMAVPQSNPIFLYHNVRERLGGTARLEYKPNDDLYAFLQGYYFQRTDTERRDETRVQRTSRTAAPTEQTPTSGLISSGVRAEAGTLEQEYDDQLRGVQLGVDWRPADGQKVSVRGGLARGSLDNPLFGSRFQSASTASLAYRYDMSGGFPVFTFVNPAYYLNPANYPSAYVSRETFITTQEDLAEFAVDYDSNADNRDGFGFQAGFKARQLKREHDEDYVEYRPVSGARFRLSDVLLDHAYTPPGYTVPQWFIDLDKSRAYLAEHPEQFSLWSGGAANSTNSDYRIEETVLAGYALATYRTDRLTLNGGIRVEQTRTESENLGVVEDVAVNKGDYVDVLPRAQLTYDFDPQLRLRAAYSRSVGRPNFDDLRPSTQTREDAGVISISGGNPELKPRVADNYDLTLEYYLPERRGMLAVGVFHKNIQDEIFSQSTLETVNIDGVDMTLLRSIPMNARSASLTGLEFGAILPSLDFLGGPMRHFGLTANFALIDSDASVPNVETASVRKYYPGDSRAVYGLFEQPRAVGNVSLTFNLGRFDSRLAYNYRGRRVTEVNTTPWFDRLFDAQETWDLQARYDVTDAVQITAQVKNLTDSYAKEVNAYEDLYYTRREAGRSFWLGVSFRL